MIAWNLQQRLKTYRRTLRRLIRQRHQSGLLLPSSIPGRSYRLSRTAKVGSKQWEPLSCDISEAGSLSWGLGGGQPRKPCPTKAFLYALGIGTLICAASSGSAGAREAALPSVTLATEDTAVRVEARADRVLLSSLKSPRGSWDWIAGNGQAGRVNVMPIPFIATAQVNGQAVPLAWKFAGSRQSKSGPRRA